LQGLAVVRAPTCRTSVAGEGIRARDGSCVIEVRSDACVCLLRASLHAPRLVGSALGAVAFTTLPQVELQLLGVFWALLSTWREEATELDPRGSKISC
jgi:hypothetical protein